MWPGGYPDFPMAQRIDAAAADSRVTISCLVSDLEYTWSLSPVQESTQVAVRVAIPAAEAHRLGSQERLIEESLDRLAVLAAASA
jgi:hypothetical protein